MKLSNYYFTFCPDADFPYQNGWVMVEAESLNQAAGAFRQFYTDVDEGTLNCEDYCTEEQFRRTGAFETGYLGGWCHKVIRREDYI